MGFFRPHVPLYAPPKWFDVIGKPEDILLPTGMKDGDFDDLPEAARLISPGVFESYQKLLQYGGVEKLREFVHAYLACVAFVDHQIGRVLTALEQSPYATNTLVVLWSDHGYHLGEKEAIGKTTLWQRSS